MSNEVSVYQHLTPEQAAIAKAAEERIKARMVAVLAENGKALREAKGTLSPARFKALQEQLEANEMYEGMLPDVY
jgi:hypothetical protein